MSEKSFVVKDSGVRQEFATGSKRDSRDGKGRFDLIPTLPLRRLAKLYEAGAVKYQSRNWEKGQPLQRYVDSAMRHLNCLVAGESTEDHATAVSWNMFAYIWTLNEIEAGRLPRELDDRPPPEPQYVESPVEVMTSVVVDGFKIDVVAWLAGGCCICGASEREGHHYAHDACWRSVITSCRRIGDALDALAPVPA